MDWSTLLCICAEYHGRGGYLTVSDGVATDLNKVYARGMRELGHDTVDCNGESQAGQLYKILQWGVSARSVVQDTAMGSLRQVSCTRYCNGESQVGQLYKILQWGVSARSVVQDTAIIHTIADQVRNSSNQ